MPQENSGNDISSGGPQNLQDYTSFDQIPERPTTGPQPKAGEREVLEAGAETEEAQAVEAVEAGEEAGADEVKETEEASEEGQEKPETDQDAPKKADTKRTLKGKHGDKEIEVPLDMVVRKKVDGQMREFKLSEIVDGFSGDLAIEKRMNDANTIKQEGLKLYEKTRQEREALNSGFAKVNELVKAGNANEGMMHFAKIIGKDPIEFISTMQSAIDELVSQARDIPAEEYEVLRARQQNEMFKNFTKQEREERENQERATAQRNAVMAEVDSACEKYGVTKEEIDAELEVCKIQQAYGKLPKDVELTAEFLARQANRVKLVGRIKGHLPKFFPNRMHDQKFVNELLSDVVSNPDFNENDWLKMAEGAKKLREANLAKKVSKKVMNGSEPRKATVTNSKLGKTAQGVESLDVWDFDSV